jgi:hypothetical protein
MKSLVRCSLSLVALVLFASLALGGEKSGPAKGGLNKPDVINQYKFLDVNQINCTINSDGVYADERRTGQSGLEWPKGSGKTAIFTAGMWLAGKHRPTGLIRTAVMDYSSEYQPGPLTETYDATLNDDSGPVARASDNKYRLYKISKNDLKQPAGFNTDLDEWPGDLGAPYTDVDGDGKWTAGVDQPKFYGDQQIWCVINDVSKSRHQSVGMGLPMGVEVRCLYFAFAQQGALGNMLFFKWTIINKSNADYDSTYISMWSDPDLGYSDDDLPGCDTTMSLGYIYNASNNDSKYGSPPPAEGFSFFEGPKVAGAPTDSAIVDGKWIHGYKNLPMASFVVYCNSTFPAIQDPPSGDPNFAEICYDYMRGKAGTVHQLLYSPTTGQPMFKWFSGDPIAGTGDIPTNFPLGVFGGQDIRVMLSAGPFTLAKGDTQEVVGAYMIAKGSSNLNSITLLKQNGTIAQDAFNSNFVVPSAPPMPTINVAQLPNRLVIDWSTGSDVTEAYNYKNNKFEGYNFYQGKSRSGPWTRIATWDVKGNGLGMIWDYVLDEATGQVIYRPVQFGTDTSGLAHYLIIDQDYLSGTPLINGKQYFFSLTTYSYNFTPGALGNLPMTLEQPTDAISNTIPREPSIGTVYSTIAQQLSTNRPGDDNLVPEVVNPTALTGLNYTVKLKGLYQNITGYDVFRTNANGSVDTLVKGATDIVGDDASPIVDGVLLRLKNPLAGVRRDTQSPNGWNYTPSANRWLTANTYLDAASHQSGIGAFYPMSGVAMSDLGNRGSKITSDHLKKVEIRFNSAQTQHAYRYLRNVPTLPAKPAQDPSFAPFILVKGSGFVYQRDYATVTVPFTVWEVDSLDGSPAPRQLNIGFLENNDSLYKVRPSTGARDSLVGLGKIDGKWAPTAANTGGDEALYIFASTYSDTANPVYAVNLYAQDSLDIYYVLWAMATSATAAPTDGDKITITPNYRLNGGRQYGYIAPAPRVGDAALGATQLEDLNVFPNPYFGHNTAESGSSYNRFVTFSHLPNVARIRIYTITGDLVRDIAHADQTTFERWDLRNKNNLPVASGVYFAHIEIPGMGSRILKIAIVQPEERPSRI